MNIQKPQKILFEINSIENLQNLEKEINEVDGKIENKIIEHQNLENIETYDFEFKVFKFSKCNIINSKLENSLEDIKGAIINEYQAISLIGLLGVKIKA